jgi:putative spermidine/putrescine transport system substrate-binding protein
VGDGGHRKLKTTSKELIWSDYGGVTRDVRQRVYFDPFQKEYGITVRIAEPDLAKFVQGAKDGTPTYDMFDLGAEKHIDLVDKGYLQKLPPEVTRTDALPLPYRDYGGGGYSYSYVMVWLADAFKGAQPETWADFFDLRKFPGKRAIGGDVAAEVALLGDGVPREKLQPLDLDRAYAKWTTIKDSLLYYQKYAEGSQFLSQGAATMLIQSNGRTLDLQAQDPRVRFTYNQSIIRPWSATPVPNGAPHPDAMFALTDFMDQPERQAAFAREIHYGPTNSKAFELLSDEDLKNLPNSPDKVKIGVVTDPRISAQQTVAAQAAYTKFSSGK